jgi:DNA-binding Lrp family transcriptional regulator
VSSDLVIAPAAIGLSVYVAQVKPLVLIDNGADGYIFSKRLNRSLMKYLRNESPAVKVTATIHLLEIAWNDSHNHALSGLAEKAGLSRETFSRSTRRLVELGILERTLRGKISPQQTRPSRYRLSEFTKQLTTKPDTGVTSDHTSDSLTTATVTGVTSDHTSTGVTSDHTLEKRYKTTSSKKLSFNATKNDVCEICAGPVTLNLQGVPNPKCKNCYQNLKNEHAKKESIKKDPAQYGQHLVDSSRVEFIELQDGTVERRVLWGEGS